MREQAEEYHNILVEAVAENDEELMEKYLEGEEIDQGRAEGCDPQGDHRQHSGSRGLRFFLQEPWRPEAAGCYRGLYARSHRRA